jgi:CubicO group peptidase (beta-lactamase class C family)
MTRTASITCGALAAALAACSAPAAHEPTTGTPATHHGANATPIDPAFGDKLTAYVDSIGRDWGDGYRFSGVVLVAQGDKVLYEHGFGYANRTTKAPITADTSFRIGSMTKQFTAAAILSLEAAGKLSVNDTIAMHLPDYPKPGSAITIHQLLSHTSGLPNYTDQAELMNARDRFHSVDDMLAVFRDKPLEFTPGSNWRYSNSNYVVLGAIIERVTKQSYAQYMHDHIFAPAGLARTVIGDAPETPDRATGYEPEGDNLVEAHPIDMSVPFAAGAVRSTARDLWRWHLALAGDRILSRAERDKLTTVVKNDYAYGWMVQDEDGHHFVQHNGGIDGFVSSYWRVMDADLVVVVLANTTRARPGLIAKAAIAAAFGKPIPPLEQGKPTELDPVVGKRVAGNYKLTAAARADLLKKGLPANALATIETVTITASSHAVALKPAGQPAVELVATGPAKFAQKKFDLELSFDLDATGSPASHAHFVQHGVVIDYERVP